MRVSPRSADHKCTVEVHPEVKGDDIAWPSMGSVDEDVFKNIVKISQ